MNFDYTDDEKALKSELRRFLAAASPTTRTRAVLDGDQAQARALTRELAAHGWLSATLPQSYDGQELGYVALCGIAEELGRALATTSFGSSIFLAAEALLLCGSEPQKEAHLPELGSGTTIGTLAIAETAGPIAERTVACTCRNGTLSGAKIAVVDGLDADIAVVAAQGATGVGLYLIDLKSRGVERAAQTSIDPTRVLAKLSFDAAPAEPLPAGQGWNRIQHVLDRAAVLFAFEQLGGADVALEMARDYALERHAFGRPIGSFQAIKHKLADVYIANELARANAYYGAWALAKDAPDLPLAAAAARVAACEAFGRAARENIQTHGGIAVTWAHDCQLYYRRARHLGSCIGTAPQWRDRMTALLAAQHAA
jgi:alkylation response protein AidB-like acyl-CoA dehydrogenase